MSQSLDHCPTAPSTNNDTTEYETMTKARNSTPSPALRMDSTGAVGTATGDRTQDETAYLLWHCRPWRPPTPCSTDSRARVATSSRRTRNLPLPSRTARATCTKAFGPRCRAEDGTRHPTPAPAHRTMRPRRPHRPPVRRGSPTTGAGRSSPMPERARSTRRCCRCCGAGVPRPRGDEPGWRG